MDIVAYILAKKAAGGEGAEALEKANLALAEIAELNEKVDGLGNGIKYKGAVDYYADLTAMSSAWTEAQKAKNVGFCYTVKYTGTSGQEECGDEYVWGKYIESGTYEWIKFGGSGSAISQYIKAAAVDSQTNTLTLTDNNDNTTTFTATRDVQLNGVSIVQNGVANFTTQDTTSGGAKSIDTEPTENSTNLVTSGGVYDAIQNAGGNYTAGTGISISNKEIGIDNTTVPLKSDLATVATTGSYNNLTDTPTIPEGITEISTSPIRITTLTPGVYKLTYGGQKSIYYNGKNSTSTVTIPNTGAVLLFVNMHSTTYWHWYCIGGSTSFDTIYYGYTTNNTGSTAGYYGSCALNGITHSSDLSSYISTSSRSNNLQSSSTTNVPSVNAVREAFTSGVNTTSYNLTYDTETYCNFGSYIQAKLPLYFTNLNLYTTYANYYELYDQSTFTYKYHYIYIGHFVDQNTSGASSYTDFDKYIVYIDFDSYSYNYVAKKYKLGEGGGSSDSPIETVEEITPALLQNNGKYYKIADTEGEETLLTWNNYSQAFTGSIYYNLSKNTATYLNNMINYYGMEIQTDPNNSANRYLNIFSISVPNQGPGDPNPTKYWQYVLYIENYEAIDRAVKLRLLSTTDTFAMGVNIIGQNSTIVDDITVWNGTTLAENSHTFGVYDPMSPYSPRILNDDMYDRLRLGMVVDGVPTEDYQFFMLAYSQAAIGDIKRVVNGSAYTLATLKDLQDAIGTVMNTPV